MVSIVERNRKLENEEDVFNHNAWDDTEWTPEMLNDANRRIQQQIEDSKNQATKIEQVEPNVSKKWDEFYQAHGDKFFKDRQWIFSEFPEISHHLESNSESCNIFEVGCGVGNAVAHIVGSNKNPNLHVYCCDLSPKAIAALKNRELYLKHADKITAFPADICKDFDDIIDHKLMKHAIQRLTTLLKPGGMILFRDYAQFDLTQLRFKGKAYLDKNYYVRADGTTSYFFTTEMVEQIFTSAGLVQVELKQDNRLLVNRLKSLKMCRCWIQAKYRKI